MNRRSIFSGIAALMLCQSISAEVIPADRAVVLWSLLNRVQMQEGMIHFCDNWAFRLQFKSQYARKDLPRSVNLGKDSKGFEECAEKARKDKAEASDALQAETLKVAKDMGYKEGAFLMIDTPSIGAINIEGEKVDGK